MSAGPAAAAGGDASDARFAEVAVDAPIEPEPPRAAAAGRPAGRDTFHYAVPSHLAGAACVGRRVWVPFGRRRCEGVVVALHAASPVERTREILDVLDAGPLLGPAEIALARWVAAYYLAPLYACLRLCLPPGRPTRETTVYTRRPTPPAADDLRRLDPAALAVLAVFEGARRLTREQVRHRAARRGLSGARVTAALAVLAARGLVDAATRVVPGAARRRGAPADPLAGMDIAPTHPLPLTVDQAAAWAVVADLLARVGPRASGIAAAGLPAGAATETSAGGVSALAEHPRAAAPAIVAGDPAAGASAAVCLVHGITGSGKTEIYLQAIADVLERGRQALVLVPEIALTAQQIRRFAGRFPGRVAVWHSELTDAERRDTWLRIHGGGADVVVGSRSAVFAPLARLGLVVVDEEHAEAFKQSNSPRYHARDAAIRRAALVGGVVLLGSATPSLESYHLARRGVYVRADLPRRVVGALPQVEIVDLRAELRAGNTSIFSAALDAALARTLAAGEQAILYLNRRGSASFILCRDCGHTVSCPRCHLPLTWHAAGQALVCHHCNHRGMPPLLCPACGSARIRHFGAGAERVEAVVRERFPAARVVRWDADTTGARGAHAAILAQLADGRADVLVGTQMIAKGLDLPMVTLVGIVSADTGLGFPDFRASERTFQLLSQVAGRAGRSALGGQVILQTYRPDHPAIVAAARHDYAAFYRGEIAFRAEHRYPPFSRLVRLVHAGESGARAAEAAAQAVADLLRRRIVELGLAETDVIGPAPAFFQRERGRSRWQLVVRAPDPHALVAGVALGPGWRVDVDPVDLL